MAGIQDKIILGLMMYADMSAYDIKKAIESSTAFFYNASMGSIHPALKKLVANRYATVSQEIDNGRTRKVHSITEAGKSAYLSWLEQGLTVPQIRDETLVRLFFFGHLDKVQQKKHLAEHINMLSQQIAALEILRTQIAQINIPKDMQEHAKFQQATLDYGLQYYRFSRDWYHKFVDDNF